MKCLVFFIPNITGAIVNMLLGSILTIVPLSVIAAPGYYRYPALHNETLVFTAEGDLWKTDINNGEAIRLTSHPFEEKEAAISPDGQFIAYTAKYEGTTEVYVIPMKGGVPKRVSYENSSVRVHGWTGEGKILYSTNGLPGPIGSWTLRIVEPETITTQTIPLSAAVEGVMDDLGETIYFIQFGEQVSRDNLKFYRGGATGELWKFQLKGSREAAQLTTKHKGSVREPMLSGKRLYFISDDSGNSNIWSMNLRGGDLKQLTHYEDWPVRTASVYRNKIVYQLGADIKLLDLASGLSRELDIQLNSDFPALAERWIKAPLKYMTSSNFAGSAEKVVITARGRVAIAGVDGARLVDVASHTEARVRQAILSHDGKYVYAISDASGEHEIWRFSATGSEDFVQLTDDGHALRWNLILSPDGKWIAHDDSHGALWLLDVESKENRKIAEGGAGGSRYDIAWSANSKLLAFGRDHREDERSRVSLYSLAEDKLLTLTGDDYHSFQPFFSSDGDWLYFLSDRHFSASPRSPWGDRNMGPAFDRRTLIFAYALKADARFPFQKPSELSINESDGKKNTDEKEKENHLVESTEKEEDEMRVDWAGIESRLWQVPVASGNYSELAVNKGFLYVLDKRTEPGAKTAIKSIKLDPWAKPETFKAGVSQFRLSNNGKKMFVALTGVDNSRQFIVEAGARFPSDVSKSRIKTKDWQLVLKPRQEWRQMFKDAWLMHREYLFDPGMRGVDWDGVKAKYQPLLDRITDRYELDDVLRHMSGEVSTFHSQVGGGDFPSHDETPASASLGATFANGPDGVSIAHIYKSNPDLTFYLSPLARPGVNAKIGDLVESVNGLKVASIVELETAIRSKAGQQVLLDLNRNGESLQTIVEPMTASQSYRSRYRDWVYGNKEKVVKANPKIGYLHLAAMGSRDVASFARDFYAEYMKDGLIIDVRRNRGGNIDSWIIEKLLRRTWSFWTAREKNAFTNMQQTFRGHLVVLADERTYSDGETFVAGIKALKLGTVIGKQTAGAGIWLRDQNRLVDKGIARAAEMPVYTMDGRWVNEGIGVMPDITVANLPHATFEGKDAQLEAAVRLLEKEIRKKPIRPMKPKKLPQNLKPADLVVED